MAVSIIPAGRLALIDAIRGFAALWVAVHHFYNGLGDSNAHVWREPLHSFCALGYLGVPIFFVLSGFVISNSLSGIDINTSVLGRFIGRRVFRLDPTYWFVIWLTVGVAVIKSWFSLGQNQGIPSFPGIVANMMYLNRLLGYGSIVKVGWTLCLEVQFYLVFVFVLWICRCAPTRQIGSMATSIFFVLAIWSIGTASGALPLTIRGLFVPHWYMFYLGLVAHRAIDSPSFRWLLAGTTVASFGAPIDQTVAASVTSLLLVVAGRFRCLSYPVGGPALQYLGRLSYSFYLIHPLVGNRFLRVLTYEAGGPIWGIGSVFAFVSALGLSLIAAELLFRLIEVPSHSLARRWFPMPSRRRDSSEPSTAIDCRDPTLESTVHQIRSLSLATVLILLWTIELWGMQATSMPTNHVAGPTFDFWAPKIRFVLDGFFVTAICLLLPAPLLYIAAFIGMVTGIGLIAYEQFFNASLSILTLLNSWNEAPFLATHVWAWVPKWPAMLLLGTFITKCWLVLQMNQYPISWKPRLTAGTVALCLYLALMYATTFVDPLSAISSKRGVARLGRIRGYLGPWIAELHYLNSPMLLAAAVERSREQSDILTPVEAPIIIRPRLVIVQAESLDYNTLGLTVNGREVTPFLNRLRARSLFYRVRAYHKLGSADADFTMLMGGPPAMNVLNYNIPGFPYDAALPHFLGKYGFETLSFHGNWGSFYRRKNAFKQMGFERIFFREELEAEFPVELDSLGIRDASVFEISSLLLRKTSDRVCHFIITLTSHDPFKFVKPDSSYPCPDNSDATERYLNHVHYLDKCLQKYIASLPADTTVVIYGDHPAGTVGLGFTPSYYNGVKYVPVFVYDNRTDLGALRVTHDEFQKPESTLRMIDFTAFLRNRIEATFATPTSDKKSQ